MGIQGIQFLINFFSSNAYNSLRATTEAYRLLLGFAGIEKEKDAIYVSRFENEAFFL